MQKPAIEEKYQLTDSHCDIYTYLWMGDVTFDAKLEKKMDEVDEKSVNHKMPPMVS